VLEQLQKIVPILYGAGLSIIKFCVNLFIALIVSIYLISDKNMIRDYAKKLTYALFSKEHALSLFAIMKDCNSICKSFFIGKTIDSLIIGCLCFILMSIFHLPYAMLISVIVGITNMIPYFGPYIGGIPGVLICFIEKPSYGIVFLVIVILLQSFDGMILGPKILGDSTGLRPIVILFSISCGGAVAGVLGMFLGVPIFGIISYLMEKYINYRLHRKNLKWDADAKDIALLNDNANTL
jgi:predicted PurR-regulated permease PerM